MAGVRKGKIFVRLGATKDTLRPHLRGLGKSARNPPLRFDPLAGAAPSSAEALKNRIFGRNPDLKTRLYGLRESRGEFEKSKLGSADSKLYSWLIRNSGLKKETIDKLVNEVGPYPIEQLGNLCGYKKFSSFVEGASPKKVGKLLKNTSWFVIKPLIDAHPNTSGKLLHEAGPDAFNKFLVAFGSSGVYKVLERENNPKNALAILKSMLRNKRKTQKR